MIRSTRSRSLSHLATAIVAAALAAGVLAACGGGNDNSSTSAATTTAATTQETTTTDTSTATTETQTTTSGSSDQAAQGKEVFTQNCGSCHTLSAAGTSGQVGPNLDDLKPSEARVVKQVNNGGGPMPAFKGTLSDAQIQAVAAYVSSSAGK